MNDDTVVGFIDPVERTERFQDDLDDDKPLMPIYASDLYEHIQDRLRAAEEMADALRKNDHHRDCPHRKTAWRWQCGQDIYDALAAYEATFKEASK